MTRAPRAFLVVAGGQFPLTGLFAYLVGPPDPSGRLRDVDPIETSVAEFET